MNNYTWVNDTYARCGRCGRYGTWSWSLDSAFLVEHVEEHDTERCGFGELSKRVERELRLTKGRAAKTNTRSFRRT